MTNYELRELIKDAPKFEHMERTELVAHAYGLYAAGNKAGDENAKLRELVRDMRKAFFALDIDHCQACPRDTINGPCTKYLVGGSDECSFEEDMRELGIEAGE